MSVRSIAFLLAVFLSIAVPFHEARAVSEAERSFLSLYFKDEELVVISATRSLKSITRVAENVEVVTKEEIELMNAHTLTDVLTAVNGLAVQFGGASPGSLAGLIIQGSGPEQAVVFIDGIAINNLLSDWAMTSHFPVQMIEKVEVIKGPASSVWGSSLGGVVNVITKSPPAAAGTAGTVAASYGTRSTTDLRAELTGRTNGLGYYAYVGRLQTNGLRSFEAQHNSSLYLKLTYDLGRDTNIGYTLLYTLGRREEGDLSVLDYLQRDRAENLLTTLNLNSRLSPGLDLNVYLRAANERFRQPIELLSSQTVIDTYSDNKKYGGSVRLSWKTGIHSIVFGADYDHKQLTSSFFDPLSPTINVFALYANDTIVIDRFAITPGIRYDHTDRHYDFTSPSLGVTYELAEKTILRASVARGFQLPNLGENTADGQYYRHNPDLSPSRVWSYQAGVESGILGFAWVKLSVFRHDIRDAIVNTDPDPVDGTWTAVNKDRVRRQGIEANVRTVKFQNFSLDASAAYVTAKNLTTGEELRELGKFNYIVSLKYDDEKSFRALLRGRCIWWDSTSFWNAKYESFVFDLNLIKTIFRKQDRACEVFVTGHNLFNGSQYADEMYKNARRWIEAGVRYKF